MIQFDLSPDTLNFVFFLSIDYGNIKILNESFNKTYFIFICLITGIKIFKKQNRKTNF